MTIIDTTLYANGALRLSRHGAGRGGNVLMHVPTGKQTTISDGIAALVDETWSDPEKREGSDPRNYFENIYHWHGIEQPKRTSRY